MTERLFRLQPWIVRMLIPSGHLGSYRLVRHWRVSYVGRSDRCLRRRLVAHAYRGEADFFGFDVHPDSLRAYTAECALFHATPSTLSNSVHPAVPANTKPSCPYCPETIALTQRLRLNLGTPRTRYSSHHPTT